MHDLYEGGPMREDGWSYISRHRLFPGGQRAKYGLRCVLKESSLQRPKLSYVRKSKKMGYKLGDSDQTAKTIVLIVLTNETCGRYKRTFF